MNGNAQYTGVRLLLQKTTNYWFGKNYTADCPEAQGRKTTACHNPAPTFTCIITRMRLVHDNETLSVTQTLNIRYNTPAGRVTTS